MCSVINMFRTDVITPHIMSETGHGNIYYHKDGRLLYVTNLFFIICSEYTFYSDVISRPTWLLKIQKKQMINIFIITEMDVYCNVQFLYNYTVFQKKTSTHIIGYKLRNSYRILIIFDTTIPYIIWHRKTAYVRPSLP